MTGLGALASFRVVRDHHIDAATNQRASGSVQSLGDVLQLFHLIVAKVERRFSFLGLHITDFLTMRRVCP